MSEKEKYFKNETTATFSERFQELINKRNKKLSCLSFDMRISTGALSNYQNGRAEPGINALKKIANYFNVSYDYLLGEAECKKPENEEIFLRLGLSEETIKVLEKAKQEGKNRAVDNIIRAVANAL